VRKNGALADSTIVIGEDGTNGVVEPPKPKPVDPGGGAAQGGGAQGGASALGGSAQGGTAQAGSAQAGMGQGGFAQAGSVSSTSGNAATGSPPSSDAGCGCRIGARGAAESQTAALVLAGLMLLRSRARRRVARVSATARTDHKK
jgi:MYXO-CTERM domain-containing protein